MDEGRVESRASWWKVVDLRSSRRAEEEDADEEEEEDDEGNEDEEDYGDDVETSDEEDLPSSPAATMKHSLKGDFGHPHTQERVPEPHSTTPDEGAGAAGVPSIIPPLPSARPLATPDTSFTASTGSTRSIGSSPLPLTPASTEVLTPDRSSDLCSSSLCSSSTSGCSDGGPGTCGVKVRGEGKWGGSSSSGVGVNSGSSDSAAVTPPASPLMGELGGDRDTLTPWCHLSQPPPVLIIPAVALREGGAARGRCSLGKVPCDKDEIDVSVGGAFGPADSALSSSLGPSGVVPLQERSALADGEKERMRWELGRTEMERALGEGWENTSLPPSGSPPTGRNKEAVSSDARRVAQSLHGSSLFLHLRSLGDTPGRGEDSSGAGEGGARALWNAVFSGKKKDGKKRGGASLPGKMAVAKERREAGNWKRSTDCQASGVSSWTEDSEVACSTVLQRCSLHPKTNLRLELFDLASDIQKVTIKEEEERENQLSLEPAYVSHALAFKRAYAMKKRSVREEASPPEGDGTSSCPTEVVGELARAKEPSSLNVTDAMFQPRREAEEEDLDARLTRRVQRAARKQAKQEQLKRLHKAQIIQRQLEQVEEKQKQLEERGIAVEKALRGEADYWGESSDNEELGLHLSGMGNLDSPALMQQWFQLVHQKNALVRYESELMIFARELELEDRQSRLQQELREQMAVDDHLKGEAELVEERLILEEMLEVVEQRDALVALLEEQRLQEREEDRDLEAVMLSRGLGLRWA